MAFHLIVRSPFGAYCRGDRISDPAELERATAHHSEHVVRVDPPAEKAPEAQATRD